MEAVFFSFSKRKNSTKVPVESTGTTFNITLKEPTSYDAPAFYLNLNADTFPYNYCKFENQYYFVSEIISRRNNLFEVHCEKDTLATYRAQIFNTSAYVLYDTVGNSEIVDSRLAIKTSRTLAENSVAFPNVSTDGIYVLTCVGENSCASWRLKYGDTPEDISLSTIWNDSYGKIYDPPTPGPSGGWLQETALAIKEAAGVIVDCFNSLGDVFQHGLSYFFTSSSAMNAIRSCIWLPFRPVITAAGDQEIYLGNYKTGVIANRILEPVVQLPQVNIAIPWQASDWRRNSPYTQVYLYIPFIGVVSLPASQLTGAETIGVLSSLNVISGDLSVNVVNGTQVLGSYGANVAMPVPLGSSNIPQRQVVNTIMSSTIGAGAAAVGGNLGLSAGAAMLSGVAASLGLQLGGVPTSVGGLSSGASSGLSTNIICFTSFHDTNVAPGSVSGAVGLPSFAVKQIGNLSGYVQCHEFSLNASAESGDLDAVNAYMNSGVFIE